MSTYDDLYDNATEDGDGDSTAQYADALDQRMQLQAENTRLKAELEISRKANVEMKTQIEKLNKEKSTLALHNKALGKNISALYKTAKVEIARKDGAIAQLREKIV